MQHSRRLPMNKFFTVLLFLVAALACVPIFAKNNPSRVQNQQTLSIIKPDAVAADKAGPIIASIEAVGLHVVAMRMTWLTSDQAAIFYAVHKDRPFYKPLVEFMSSGPIIAMVLEGDNSVEAYRKLMGATDPVKALLGTLRKEFGTSVERNAVHGSDSLENAKKEIGFFFTEGQIYSGNK
jgi:nucleoside-diphosphate kinase